MKQCQSDSPISQEKNQDSFNRPYDRTKIESTAISSIKSNWIQQEPVKH